MIFVGIYGWGGKCHYKEPNWRQTKLAHIMCFFSCIICMVNHNDDSDTIQKKKKKKQVGHQLQT